MNITNKLIWIFLFVGCVLLMSFLKDAKAKNRKIIFFGDSITQAGVLPNGYISVMKDMLSKQNISNYDLVGAGIGGNKVYDLYLRMKTDVIAQSPDIVVIYVGVNDVWHKRSFGTGTDPDKFERFYQAIIDKIRSKGAKVVVCTPAVIGEKTDNSNEQDGDLNKYSGIVRDLARKNNLPLVDLRKIFLDYNLKNNPENKESGILTADRVHLNERGNELVAEEMWKVISTLK